MTRPIGPHPTTLRKRPQKPSYAKGVRDHDCNILSLAKLTSAIFFFTILQKQGKRSLLAKQVAREVCGFAPYEKRAIELLRNSLDKRALRVCKKKVGFSTFLARKAQSIYFIFYFIF